MEKDQDKEELIELKKSLQESLISIILDNFQVNANVNVQKVGLIYLATILKRFPDLCTRYLDVLLTISEEIRATVLNIDLYNDADSHIVLSTTSFKYKQTGAPLEWNSVGIAQALNSYVKEQKLERFETEHIDILAGCLINELDEREKDAWLVIYQDLQKYIFVSLAAPELCGTASIIVKKFFMCSFLQETIMENTYNLFLRILELVYQADIDISCKENMLALFEYLIKEGENFKEYVYNIIREYSENNKAKFLGTNLVDFMNNLARERRIRMFGENPIETFSF